jgi:hypothetical protein
VSPARILVSARDPGGAAQIREVVRALRAAAGVDLVVAASGVAHEILTAAGEAPEAFALPGGATHVPSGGDPARLLEAARGLLGRLRPDAILVGISSLGVGLDEALLACADGRPTFALQDYPGDANAIDGRYAGTYFVRDETAARLTRRRFGVVAIPVGSLRHAAYARLDVAALRRSTRARIGLDDARPLIGFFGQPAQIPGHEAGFAHLVSALADRRPPPVLLLREHPKTMELRQTHLSALREAGVETHDASGSDGAEAWLAACDVVTTCFSHTTIDYAFLNACSDAPLGAVLFLMTTPEIRTFMRDYTGLDLPDGVDAGLGAVAEHPADVAPLLDTLLAEPARRAYHASARRLPRRADVETIVGTVLDAARARGAAPTGRR